MAFLLAQLAAEAQDSTNFLYESFGNTITITEYVGSGGPVIIPDTIDGLPVIGIGDWTFSESAVTSVRMGSGIGSIGRWAFNGCTSLTNAPSLQWVTFLGNYAFQACRSLTNVTIPATISQMEHGVFSGCASLSSVTIGDGIPYLPGSTFAGCTSLTNVVLPPSVTSIEPDTFAGCSNLSTLAIPAGVTCIQDGAFQNCASLTNIAISQSIYSIGRLAFSGCASLTNVTIPSSVTFIGGAAFSSCTSLNGITVAAANPNYASADGVLFDNSRTTLMQYPGGRSGGYDVPDGVTSIAESAFGGCVALTNVAIPESVTDIGRGVFDGCTSLTAITVDPSNPSYSSLDGVLFDKDRSTLIQCPAGKSGSYEVPSGVGSIGMGGFVGCSALTSIAIPASVESIGAGAFSGCSALTSFDVDSSNPSFSSLDGVLFNKGQTSLILYPVAKSGAYRVPNGVTAIQDGSFRGCTALTAVIIPSSVMNIGFLALADCLQLTKLFFEGAPPMLGQIGFYPYQATAYYLPGMEGWDSTFGGLATAIWLPAILTDDPGFGVGTGQFGFIIGWGGDAVVLVEASTTLSESVWVPVSTTALTSGLATFTDPDWENHPHRYYRLRAP